MAPVTKKSASTTQKFTVDFSSPASDGIFDAAAFEKYLVDHIKVEGKTGQLGEAVKITKDDSKLTITSSVPFSKRYIKYLTKKFLKKNLLREWIRVVATGKSEYTLRFYNVSAGNDDEE